MSIQVLAYLRSGDDPALLAAALEAEVEAVVLGGDDPGGLGRQALEAGLTVSALVAGEGDDLEAVADELGAWMVLDDDEDAPSRVVRVSDEAGAEAAAAAVEQPEAYLWVAPGDLDPGEARDEALAELVDGLIEAGFEGGVGVRAAGPARLAQLVTVVQEAIEARGSWWDGAKD